MTLAYRLFITFVIGAIVAACVHFFLFKRAPGQVQSTAVASTASAPAVAGNFRTKTRLGEYRLSFDGGKALMVFTDKKKVSTSYRGPVAPGDGGLMITWNEIKTGQEWASLPSPVQDPVKVISQDKITAAEGTFSRTK